jgi:hypothetical protein
MWFDALVFVVAVLAASVASVAGFGIGSILTPALAPSVGTKLAVAAVSIPHLAGTALRLWRLRRHVDRQVLEGFGLASAAGGLMGAFVFALAGSATLAVTFGFLLLLAGLSEWTGLNRRVRLGRTAAWVAGGASGVFGGMVGNQGGIRTAALLTFSLERHAFVATATATALLVDLGRMPVYLATEGPALVDMAGTIALLTAGVVVGTLAGEGVLRRLPEDIFRRAVATMLVALGIVMLTRGM